MTYPKQFPIHFVTLPMRTYYLKTQQFLPITMASAWEFFSSPRNLALITPKCLNFEIIARDEKMFKGQVIHYKITVLPLIRMHWETEITEVIDQQCFTDKQRKGPYARWIHKHTFMEVKGGVEMHDELEYAMPFGPLGIFANFLYVGREVKTIFDYRFHVLNERFNEAS